MCIRDRYSSSKTNKPEPGTPSSEVTGYQALKYEYSSQQRRNDWVEYVSKPAPPPTDVISNIVEILKVWKAYWESPSRSSKLDALIKADELAAAAG